MHKNTSMAVTFAPSAVGADVSTFSVLSLASDAAADNSAIVASDITDLQVFPFYFRVSKILQIELLYFT